MNKIIDPTFSNRLPRGAANNIVMPVPSRNLVIVLYDIWEQTMGNDLGYLAIVDEANDSKIILKSDALSFQAWSSESVVLSKGEEYVLFQRGIYSDEDSIADYSFFIFRLSDLSFGFYKMRDGFKYQPVEQDDLKFELREKVNGEFTDKVGGEININTIKFYPVSEVDRIIEIYIAEK